MGLLRRSKGHSIEQVTSMVESYELPTFSQIVAQALQELSDPDVDLDQVAELIGRDPGVSVHLLRLANSAAIGLRNRVDSLNRAVVMLGRNQVESILISKAVRTSLASTASVIDPRRFWTTAAQRAVVAGELASLLDPVRRSEHVTGGLLQDMALLVLADNVTGYDGLLRSWYEGEVTDLGAEELSSFGWDHATVGAAMCRVWGFPENLVASVGNHHHHDQEPSPTQLVAAWHETDLERGPADLYARTATHPKLAGRIDGVLETATAQTEEIAGAFV